MKTKPFYQSKTLWVQLISIFSILFPSVQQWVAQNPVEATSVFAALNTLVRFVTSGKIEAFSSVSRLPLWMVGVSTAVALGLLLPSCNSLQGLQGSFNYKSPKTGIEYGLECDEEGCRPRLKSQPFIDDNGNVIGEFEIISNK